MKTNWEHSDHAPSWYATRYALQQQIDEIFRWRAFRHPAGYEKGNLDRPVSIQVTDIMASNGITHVIGDVLLPAAL